MSASYIVLHSPRIAASNWTKPNNLLRCSDEVDPTSLRLLRVTQSRIRRNRIFQNDDYYPGTAALLAMSGWPLAWRFCYCGVRSQLNRSGMCGMVKLCPRCNYVVRVRKYEKQFRRTFHRTGLFFVTISFTTPDGNVERFYYEAPEAVPRVGFEGWRPYWEGEIDCRDMDDFDYDGESLMFKEVRAHWDVCRDAFKELRQCGVFHGVMWNEELSVRFAPIRLLPHVHGVISADDCGQNRADELAQFVENYLANTSGLRVRLKPSVRIVRLNTEADFFNVLGYSMKPLNLVQPYEAAWLQADLQQRGIDLNTEVSELLPKLAELTRRRRQVRRIGNFCAQSRAFIARDIPQ